MKVRIIMIFAVTIVMACSFLPKSSTSTPKIATVTKRSEQATSTKPPIQVKPSATFTYTKTPKQVEPTATYKSDIKTLFSEWAPQHTFMIVGDNLYEWSEGGKFNAYNVKTGDLLWSTQIDNTQISYIDDTIIYTIPTARRMDAFDLKTGKFLWRTLYDSDLLPLDKFRIYTDDKLYVFTANLPNFHTIDKSNGAILSSQSIQVKNTSPHIYEKTAIFRETNSLIGFSPQEGEIKWTKELHNRKYKFCGKTVVIYPEVYSDVDIEGIDVISGETIWSNDLRRVSDVLCVDNGQDVNTIYLYDIAYLGPLKPGYFLGSQSTRVYIILETGGIVAVDKNTGSQIWDNQDKFTSGIKITDKVAWLGESAGEVLYYAHDYGITQAYNAETHELIWENPNLNINGLLGSSGDSIFGLWMNDYYGKYPVYKIYCINKNTGMINWERDMGSAEVYALIVTEDWLIYEMQTVLSNIPPEMYFIDVKTGNEKKHTELTYKIYTLGIVKDMLIYGPPFNFVNLK